MVQKIGDVLILGASLLLGFRLLVSGLSGRYRAFFSYLIFYLLQTGFMISLDVRSDLYQKVYILTEPIGWIFGALVVLELYSLVLEDYRGLYSAGKWVLMAAVVLALIASALSLMVPSHDPARQSKVLAFEFVAARAIYFSLVVFLFTILVFVMQYPLSLRRNSILHSIVFSVYFLSNTVIYLVLSTGGYATIHTVTYLMQGVTLASLCTWLLMLKPSGEELKVSLRPEWMPGREEVLITQLNSLNAALLRSGRK